MDDEEVGGVGGGIYSRGRREVDVALNPCLLEDAGGSLLFREVAQRFWLEVDRGSHLPAAYRSFSAFLRSRDSIHSGESVATLLVICMTV